MVIVKEIIRTFYSCSDDIKFDIDVAINKLSKNGILSEMETLVLEVTKEQYSLIVAGELLGISKSAVGRTLDAACKKLAVHLGSEYQEVKILKAAEDKLGRKLTREERSFCWKKMRDFGRNKYAEVNIFNFKDKFS